MTQQYQYAFTLQAHSQDVRHILAPQPGVPLLLSGSRDGSACLWGPSSSALAPGSGSGSGFGSAGAGVGVIGGGEEWNVKLRVEGPEKRFVSCVGMVRAQGEAFLLLGSSNGVLSTFMLPSPTSPPPSSASPEPHHTLIEHKQNLCCMDTSKAGLIASGSWDKTVKIWKDFKVALTIEAHAQAVWAVKFVGEDRVLTADNKIKLHSIDVGNGKSTVMQEYTGHTQPVRGLSLKTDGKGFWSCANDGLVNIYSFDKPPPETSLSGHTSFVYSVTALPDGSGAITSGEDGTMRVWSIQTIPHPATSIWSNTIVPSGKGNGYYIASSANDGQIRLFTKDPALAATGTIKEGWDQEVKSRQLDKSQVGDVKHSDLPGMEALGREGKKDGQVLMIKNNDKVEAYQWSAGESTWQQIGQVVDAVGSGRRQLYEGQEYDYVFDVDVAEGMPPLKLPYNVAENPWVAAQRFLAKHDLPPSYAEQVVEFIHKSTGGVQLGTGDANTYVDPFTGGSRYTGASTGSSSGGGAGYSDPFTGEGAYSSQPKPPPKGILPVTTILSFKTMNVAAAKSKISSINAQQKYLSDGEMGELEKVYAFLQQPVAGQKQDGGEIDGGVVLGAVGKMGVEDRFPVIDIIRPLCALSSSFTLTPNLLSSLLAACTWGQTISSKGQETNTLLVSRALANMFSTPEGKGVMGEAAVGLLGELEGKGDWGGRGGGKWGGGMATVGLNYSVMAVQGDLHASAGPALLSFLLKILDNEQGDNESIYRTGVALGNLLTAKGFSGGLQVGQVQQAKSLFSARATKLGEKRLVDLAAELDRMGA